MVLLCKIKMDKISIYQHSTYLFLFLTVSDIAYGVVLLQALTASFYPRTLGSFVAPSLHPEFQLSDAITFGSLKRICMFWSFRPPPSFRDKSNLLYHASTIPSSTSFLALYLPPETSQSSTLIGASPMIVGRSADPVSMYLPLCIQINREHAQQLAESQWSSWAQAFVFIHRLLQCCY